jgi:hypothetical protein
MLPEEHERKENKLRSIVVLIYFTKLIKSIIKSFISVDSFKAFRLLKHDL